MSCTLTRGRGRKCKDSVGGIRKIYFVKYGELGNRTLSRDILTDLDGTFFYYTYEVASSSLSSNLSVDYINGISSFEQNLEVKLTGLSEDDHYEMRALANSEFHVFTEDYKGNAFCVGLYNGVKLESSSISFGSVLGDFNGYDLTLKGKELCLPNFVQGSIKDNPFYGMPSVNAINFEGGEDYITVDTTLITADNTQITI